MRNKCVQMSLEDIYNDVSKSMEDNKPALIELLESHIDFESIIPAGFYKAFQMVDMPSAIWKALFAPLCYRNCWAYQQMHFYSQY